MELFLKKLGNGQDNDKENDVGTDKKVAHDDAEKERLK